MEGNQELDLLSSHNHFLYHTDLNDVLAYNVCNNQLSDLVASAPNCDSVCQKVSSSEQVCLNSLISVSRVAQFSRKLYFGC